MVGVQESVVRCPILLLEDGPIVCGLFLAFAANINQFFYSDGGFILSLVPCTMPDGLDICCLVGEAEYMLGLDSGRPNFNFMNGAYGRKFGPSSERRPIASR